MLILLGLTVLTIVGFVLMSNYDTDILGAIIVTIFGLALLVSLLLIGFNQTIGGSQVEEYNAFVKTLELARSNGEIEIERATVTNGVIEWNQRIARAKYWNDGLFDIFIHDGVADLEYIEWTGVTKCTQAT